MQEADGDFNKDGVSVPQYDLRSHAVPVHDAQVDASNVIGDANASQGQTRARTQHSPQLAAAAPPASATQMYTAPSVLTRKEYQGWTLGMHVPAHAKLELLSDIQLGRALVHHQYPVGYFKHPDPADSFEDVMLVTPLVLNTLTLFAITSMPYCSPANVG